MGRLVVLEGLDGSGKSTQLSLLCSYLSSKQYRFREISFPDYDDPSSTLVKMYLAGEFGTQASDVGAYAASTFYAVDRYASFKRHWGEDYYSGKVIVAGRYVTSNAIHQMTKLPSGEWDSYLDWLEDFEYCKIGVPKPDLVLFLDMPVAVSQRLLSHRYCGDEAKKDIHERDIAYLGDCYRAAQYAARRQGWQVIRCAEGDAPRRAEEISADIIQATAAVFSSDFAGQAKL